MKVKINLSVSDIALLNKISRNQKKSIEETSLDLLKKVLKTASRKRGNRVSCFN